MSQFHSISGYFIPWGVGKVTLLIFGHLVESRTEHHFCCETRILISVPRSMPRVINISKKFEKKKKGKERRKFKRKREKITEMKKNIRERTRESC